MIRTTTRALGALLIAFLGLSTVHVSAQVEADKVLPTVAFGQTVNSIALNTVMVEDEDGDEERLFSNSDIMSLATGDTDCSVSHHHFKSSVTDVTDTDNDDLVEDVSTSFTGVACSISGAGSGKILTITVAESTARADDDQGVAKVTVDPNDDDVPDDTGTPNVDESRNNDAKVFDQKVLHNIVVKDDLEDICGLEEVTGGTDTISMSVNVDECDAADFFEIQVRTGVSFTYALTGSPAETEIDSGGDITKTGVAAETVTVTAQAMTGRGSNAAPRGPVATTTDISFVGTAGRSSAGATVQRGTGSALERLALGESNTENHIGQWFVLGDQATAPVKYTSSSSAGLEDTLNVITHLTTGALDLDGDGATTTTDVGGIDESSVPAGVYAHLTVKAIGVGGQSVTVKATQGTGDDAVSVTVRQRYMVEETTVFQTLAVELADEWEENSNKATDLETLNSVVSSNIDSDTANYDIDYEVSSSPSGLFVLVDDDEDGEPDRDATTGAPEIEWAGTGTNRKKVPDAEDHDSFTVTVSATPSGGDKEDLVVTINIENVNDEADFEGCEDEDFVLDAIFVEEAGEHRILHSALEGMALACVEDDDGDEITASVRSATPACDEDDDGDAEFPDGENICAATDDGTDDDGDEAVVIHTTAADTAGTTKKTITIPVRVTVDSPIVGEADDTETYNFTKEVVVLTGSNTAPRFKGGASQVTVKVKETTKAGVEIGPEDDGAWTATDVNAAGDGDDEVTHSLANNGKGTGFCLTADEDTGEVETARCNPKSTTDKSAGIDFEKTGASFTTTLIATDKFGGTAQLQIVVTVEDQAESPTRTDEEVPTDAIALNPSDTSHEIDLGDYFEDPDGLPLEFEVSSSNENAAGAAVNGSMLVITAGDMSGTATITATLTGPFGEGEELEDDSVEFSVTNLVLDAASNTKPEFANGLASVEYRVSESAAGGSNVGAPHEVSNGAEGSDEANYDKLTYSVSETEAFDVDAETGQIMVVADKLDFETSPKDVFYLTVTDSFGETDTLKVSVDVSDANEAPTVTAYGIALSEAAEGHTGMVVEGGMTQLNLRDAFADQDSVDKYQLNISHEVENPMRLEVVIDEDDVAMLMGLSAGATDVHLSATDSAGHTVSTYRTEDGMTKGVKFSVTVVANGAPTVADAIDDRPVYTGTVVDVPLGGVFSDPNLAIGDEVMVASAESSNQASVIASLNDDHSAVTLVGRAVGAATVTVCAQDSAEAEVCDEFEVHVMDEPPPNNAPEVENALAGVTIIEGETMDVDLSSVFSDADDDDLTLTATSSDEDVASVGEIEDGMMTITASMLGDNDVVASADITVMADDGNGGTASDVFTVVVVEANNAPTVASAQPDVSIIEGESADVDLSGVFTDPDGDTLTLSAESADETVASVGEVGDDGMVTITVALLADDDVESDSTMVTVTADDGRGGTVSDTFDVVVVQANRPPMVAMSLSGISVEEGGSQDVDVSEAFTDADGDELTLTASSSDADLVSVGEIGDDGMLTVTAGMLADGADSGSADVTVTADDGSDGTVSDTFTVIVLRGNEPPVVANALSGVTIVEGHTSDVDVSDVFSDPDGDDLTLSAMTSDGDVAAISEIGDDGMLTITAGMLEEGAQSASADVTVKADDGHGGNARDTFTVVVIPDNEPPTVIASIGSVDIFQLMDLDVDLSGVFEDPDGDDLVLTAISADAGLASLGEIGEDQMLGITAGKLNRGQTETMTEVTVTASDGEFEVSDTFTVNILRNNIAPVVAMSVDSQLITRGTPITIDVSGVFTDEDAATDPNDDELSLTVMVGDTTIVGADLDNGMISLDLEGIAPGMTAVTLTATDLYGGMAETSFEAMVDTRPEAISSISPIALEIGGEGYDLNLMTLFRDDDGDTLTYDISLSPSGIASYSMSGMTVNLMPASRGSTTLMVTASDARGYSVSLSGSISVGDEEIRKVAETALAAYARQMITSVDSAVGSRLLSGSQISDLQLASTTNSLTGTQTATASSEDANVMDVLDPNMWTTGNTQQQSQMSGKQGVLNALGLNRQSFAMKLNATEGAGAWSVWGTTDRQNFEGASYDGMASSVYLGVDLQATECFLVGATVARNSGEIDYWYGTAEQSMDTEQTTFLPYFRYDFDPQTSVWGVAGIGSGDVDSTVVGTSNQSSDLDSTLYMFGLRRGLSKMGAVDLALRGDVAMANIETASGDGAVDGLSADVNRIRAGLEGSYTVDMGDGGTFAPFGELSLRNDGGDGDTGTGVEVSGGFRVNLNSFNLEARGRTLASHGADDYEESGFSLTATLNPAADGSGLSFSLAPRWGGSALSSGTFWAESGAFNQGQGLNSFGYGDALEARIGYGKRIMGERFMLTPFADVEAGDDVRQYLLGARLDQLINASSSLNVDMAVGRVERRSTGEAGAQVGLNATLRF